MKEAIQSFLIIAAAAALLSVCGRKGPEGPPDLSPPVVVATSPADQTTEVPADTVLSVTFSEAVSAGTVTLVLVDITNHIPAVPMSMSCTGAAAVFTPNGVLKLNSLYGATVRSGVKDAAGNGMVADHTWYFRTSATMVTSPTHTVTATAGANGTITPGGAAAVRHNATQSFSLAASAGFHIASVTGCNGALNGTTYTTGPVTADCAVTAAFAADTASTHTATASAGPNGSITPASATVADGATAQFTVAANSGYHVLSVTGCGGTLSGPVYTTGRITADCAVTASFTADAPLTHKVTATAGANGRIEPGTATVLDGASAQFTVTPSAGYHITSVSGCGGSLSGNTYTTGAVAADCTITASFAVDAPLTHTITATAGANGSIEPGTATVVHGGTRQFTVTPAPGYHIDSVSGCGGSLSGNTYTTGAVTADCAITASFTPDAAAKHRIEASADSHGEIIPNGVVTVPDGQDMAFEIKADTGYIINEVTVDGKNIDAPRRTSFTYTFFHVTSNHTIKAKFKGFWNVVKASAGPNGSITPSGTVLVEEGADKAFVISPVSAEYAIEDVQVDNSSVGAVPNYTFVAVSSDHTISASFAQTAPVSFTVTPAAGANGSITPAEPVTVAQGTAATFTISPADGHHVLSVTGCEGSLAGDIYTTGAVTADCFVTASFEADAPGGAAEFKM